MLIVVDTHVHFHPCHDLGAGLTGALRSMDSAAGGAPHANLLCLAEKSGAHAFRDVRSGGLVVPGFRVERGAEEESVRIEMTAANSGLWLVAGRQITTAERLEVLALGRDADVPDGLPAPETVSLVSAAGAAPVLCWAVGKWTFGRAGIVRNLIESADPSALLIGDSSMRPSGFPEPELMRRARARGFSVLAGSDPFPLPGEERFMGSYCSVLDGGFDPSRPAESLRRILLSRPAASNAGRRRGLFRVLARMIRPR